MKLIRLAVTLFIASFIFGSCYPAVKAIIALPQTGWPCLAKKVFALSTDELIAAPDFKVYSGAQLVASGKMIYKGKYWNLYQYSADISSLITEGFYTLSVENYAETSFIISNYVFKRMKNERGYATIPEMINTFWHFQRCSPEKCHTPEWNFSGYFKHVNDSGLPLYQDSGSIKKLISGFSKELYGGWHDAVSVDKETPNLASSVVNMCHALEKISDTSERSALLDEMKWGLAYLLKVQNEDGSLPACIWGYYSWENPALPRHVEINKATGIIARCAAAFAVAATILKDNDPELAGKSLEAGKKAWTWIEQNPDHFEFDNLPSFRTGSAGTVLGAAVELARATGEKKYFSYTDSIISLGTFYNLGFWAKDTVLSGSGKFAGQLFNVWVAQMDEASYGQTVVALARYYNVTLNSAVKARIGNLCQNYMNKIKAQSNNPYSICESLMEPWWGFVPNNTDLAKCLLQIGLELNNSEASALALKQFEWALGSNPLGQSCIVGFGNPGFNVQICARTPENTVGGLMPGMILLNGELSTYYGPYNQWSICEVGESSAVLFDLLAGFNKIYNPKDSVADLPDSVQSKPSSLRSLPNQPENYFNLSPNPAYDRVNITFKINSNQKVEFFVSTLTSIIRKVIITVKNEGSFALNTTTFAAGYYLMTMSIDGIVKDHKSFIIVK